MHEDVDAEHDEDVGRVGGADQDAEAGEEGAGCVGDEADRVDVGRNGCGRRRSGRGGGQGAADAEPGGGGESRHDVHGGRGEGRV